MMLETRRRTNSTLWNLTFLTLAACLVAASLVAQEGKKTDSGPGGGAGTETATGGDGADGQSSKQAGGDAEEHPESYLDFAVAGGYLMIPLGVCSLIWLTFLVERLFATRRGRILPGSLVVAVRSLPEGPTENEQVESICKANDSSGARILHAAAVHVTDSQEEIEQAVNNAAQREIHVMRRYLRLFAVIAAVAPLLGLLGTVTGMIQAFREVAVAGLGSGKALAPGIYKALVTTAGGLIVAIPALLTHYWMQSRIENYVHGIDRMVIDFVDRHRPRRTEGSSSESLAGVSRVGAGSS